MRWDQIAVHRQLGQQRSDNLEKGIEQQQNEGEADYQLVGPHIGKQPTHQARIVSFTEYFFFQIDCLATSLTLTMNGLVLIDKPSGCTSHDVVNRWRKLAGTKRVGHLGTLDPMATGLLLLVTGTGTRLAPFFEKDQKTYDAEITLGLVSDTYDVEGQIVATGLPIPDHQTIES